MSNHSYFYARAEAELTMARRAACAEARKAHYVLAGYYLDRWSSSVAPSHGADEAGLRLALGWAGGA